MKKVSVILLLALCLFADPVDDLKAREWYEVPNSHLYDVRPAGFTANVIVPETFSIRRWIFSR